MGGGDRRMRCRARQSDARSIARRSTAVVFAFALIVQLFAGAMPPSSAFAGAEDAAIAAQLKAVFGDTAELCVQINDDKGSSKHAPSSHCSDQCLLCRFAAQALAFVSPDVPRLRERIADSHSIRAGPDFRALFACPRRSNRARAPPLAV